MKSKVETQITDAVTVTKKQKKKKEKKPLEVSEENVILEQDKIEKTFYEEQPRPDLGYRRGISL
jgi:hypothetical protein